MTNFHDDQRQTTVTASRLSSHATYTWSYTTASNYSVPRRKRQPRYLSGHNVMFDGVMPICGHRSKYIRDERVKKIPQATKNPHAFSHPALCHFAFRLANVPRLCISKFFKQLVDVNHEQVATVV